MKKRRILMLVMAAVLAFNTVIYAKTSTEDLLKNYKSEFEYSDEAIGNALKSSTVYVQAVFDAKMSYKPVTIREDMLINDIVGYQLANPDIDPQVVYDYVLSDIYSYLYYTDARQIETGAFPAWNGSGVVISEDGYIATNRHVVEILDGDIENACINYVLYDVLVEGYADIIESIEHVFGSGVLSEDDQNELWNLLVNAYRKYTTISDSKVSYEVMFPGANGETNFDASRTYDAKVVEIGGDSSAEDGAIIKIDAENLIALPLETEYPESGKNVWAAGFPSNADMEQESARLAVTITNGIVSAVKKYDDSRYKVIQVDANVDHGNSGGPSVGKSLKVLGLNTFGKITDTQGNFNFMVSAELIDGLADSVEIEQNEASKLFMLGLQAMDGKYGETAVECFKRVKELNPEVPYINELIEKAEKLPQKKMGGLDIKTIAIYGGICLGGLLLILIIILIIVKLAKGKKKKVVFQSYGTISGDTLESEISGSSGMLSLEESGGLLTDSDSNAGDGGDLLPW